MGLLGNGQFAGGNRRGAMMGQGPQGSTGGGRGMGGKFPNNKEDVMKFIVDLSRAMYSDKQQAQLVELLKQGSNNIGQTIGQLAGSLVMAVIQRRMHEQGVSKPHVQLAVQGLKFTIQALAEMAENIGIRVTPQDMQEAASVGGAIAESAGQNNGRANQMQGNQQHAMAQQQSPAKSGNMQRTAMRGNPGGQMMQQRPNMVTR